MSFILVDEILRFEKGQSILAAKDTSSLKDYFIDDALCGTVVPHTLVAEAVAQAAGWLITASLDFKKRGLLVALGLLEFGGLVRPGDRLVMKAELISLHEDAAMLTGQASVGDRLVGKVDSGLCVLTDAGELEEAAITRAMFQSLSKKRNVSVPR